MGCNDSKILHDKGGIINSLSFENSDQHLPNNVKIYNDSVTKQITDEEIQLWEKIEKEGKIGESQHLLMPIAVDIKKRIQVFPRYECDLFQIITKERTFTFTENELLCIILNIASAIKVLHDLNYVHCDISLENVFFSSVNNVVLGDFEKITNNKKLKHIRTKIRCAPPEYWAEPKNIVDKSYDIFCFGYLSFVVLTNGQVPFSITDGRSCAWWRLFRDDKVKFEKNLKPKTSRRNLDICYDMMKTVSKSRPTIDLVIEWFTQQLT